MKIIHRFSFNVDTLAKQKLHSFGIRVEEGFSAFEIDENDRSWPDVKKMMEDHRVLPLSRTEFTDEELAGAKLLTLHPSWYWDYPMPDDDFGYRELTYDLSNWCRQCHVGAVQKAPFRLRKEPMWGKHDVFALHWVFDEFFTKPETWEKVFRPLGINSMPAIHYRTMKELSTVVQLRIDRLASFDLDVSGLVREDCLMCSRSKYRFPTRGMFPAFRGNQDPSIVIVKTKEYFGSGGQAGREVVVNHTFYEATVSARLKHIEFTPVSET